MRVRYIGPHDVVHILDLDLYCAAGDTVDVPDAIGENLAAQHTWEAVAVSAPTTKKNKAAAEATTPDEPAAPAADEES